MNHEQQIAAAKALFIEASTQAERQVVANVIHHKTRKSIYFRSAHLEAAQIALERAEALAAAIFEAAIGGT